MVRCLQDKNATCEWFEWANLEELEGAVGQPQPGDNQVVESPPQPADLEFVKVCLQLDDIKRKNDKLKRKVHAERLKKNLAMMAVAFSWVVSLVMYFSLGKA